MIKNTIPDFVKTSPIHRWTSEFIDSSKEQIYRQHHQRFQRTILLVFIFIGIIAAPLSAIGTWPNIAGNAAAIQTVIIHRTLSALCYGILMVIAFRTTNYRILDILVIVATLLIIANTYSLQLYANPEGIGSIFRAFVLVLFSLAMFETGLLIFVIMYCSIIAILCHQFLSFLALSQSETWTSIVVLALLGVFGVLYRWQNEKRRRLVFALNSNLVELHDKLELANEELTRQTLTDPLTGLGNRRAYDQHLIAEVQKSQRFGTNYAIAIMDVDHFKEVNDTHGHAVGDQVLKGIAEILSANTRAYELLARIGGEEFAIIFTQIDKNSAVAKLNSLREKIQENLFQAGDVSFSCTISAGISLSNDDLTLTQVHEAADEALYEAKNRGRNRVSSR